MRKHDTAGSGRRAFLRKTGVAGSVLATASMAGCIGQLTGSGNSSATLDILAAPDGFPGVIFNHIQNETNILTDAMDEAGTEANVKTSWEEGALFAAGQSDVALIGSLEAARLAGEREIPLTIFGKLMAQHPGLIIRPDSQYHPDVAGSVDDALRQTAEDGARIGFGGWGAGSVPPFQVLFGALDLSYTEDGDVNCIQVGYGAMAQSVIDGNIAMATTNPIYTDPAYYVGDDPDLTMMMVVGDELFKKGYGQPTINAFTATQEYADENPDALAALNDAYQEGLDWFWSDPTGIMSEEVNYSKTSASSPEEGRYLVEWAGGQHHSGTNLMFEEVALDDGYVEKDREFFEAALPYDAVPADYEDWFDYTVF